MQIDAMQTVVKLLGRATSRAEIAPCGKQKDGLAAGWIHNLGSWVAIHSPRGKVICNRLRSEKGPTSFSGVSGIGHGGRRTLAFGPDPTCRRRTRQGIASPEISPRPLPCTRPTKASGGFCL